MGNKTLILALERGLFIKATIKITKTIKGKK
jgi:hypothetical protein